jgi:hypothetical protein
MGRGEKESEEEKAREGEKEKLKGKEGRRLDTPVGRDLSPWQKVSTDH